MNVSDAIISRRSIRRFSERSIEPHIIKRIVELGRLYASGGNLQPIRMCIAASEQMLEKLHPCFHWAMYIPGFEIKSEQRPKAYIVLSVDHTVRKDADFDLGACATTIMLAASEYGLSSCCLGSFDKAQLSELLSLPAEAAPALGIALGYPDQTSEIEEYSTTQKYWLDERGNFHVPKRSMQDIVLFSDID